MLTGWQPRSYIARKLIQKLAPDVVHGIRNLEGYGAMAVQSGFPHVITPQEFLDQVPRPPHLRLSFAIGSRMESLTLKKTRNLIVTTDVVEQWVAPRSQARRFRIPNIVADTFYRTPKAPSGDDVLFVGRLAPEKGVLDLLQALKIAGERGKRIRAQIVGGGSSEVFFQECRDFVAQHFEPEQVTFLGWQSSEAIAQLHAKSSLFIMPSLAPYETMGIVLAEALAAGTPSIVYDFGPMPKMIRHGETGWVVPPGNVEAMAAAMMRFLDEKQTLEIMSSKARAAAEPFTTSAVVRAHLQAYQTIASQDR
jgi:glycosyltransferase involved in cell wall biosynthesis